MSLLLASTYLPPTNPTELSVVTKINWVHYKMRIQTTRTYRYSTRPTVLRNKLVPK